ncbi:Uu.00g137090.m01.CDS01 [Anthostomella pinea]|uniref:Uu.00g137090.m01.CDS01 n=1 Tax=Anthostomella pinea TaxID=933095 RepID=A0AAI8VQ78_9PEZI|nr:Uu.00g137090.m01.CDS01 [Anthostomella pinea]
MSKVSINQDLPLRPEDISSEWLSSVLGCIVESFTMTFTTLNATTGKVFVTISYKHTVETDRPTHVCLKGSFNPSMMALEGYRELLLAMYTREVEFFNQIAPRIPAIKLPKVWRALASTHQGLLVMDDLYQMGYTFGEPAIPWAVDKVVAGVEQLAVLHAATWNTTEYPWLTPSYEEVMIGLADQWENVVLGADRPPIPDMIQNKDRTVAAMRKHFATKNSKFLCVVHGDPHLGNTFLDREGQPGFLDWQTAHIGSAFHDVAYFVIGSLSIDDRQEHEIAILERYLAQLARLGCSRLSAQEEDVLTEYKKSMMAGMGWVLTPFAI